MPQKPKPPQSISISMNVPCLKDFMLAEVLKTLALHSTCSLLGQHRDQRGMAACRIRLRQAWENSHSLLKTTNCSGHPQQAEFAHLTNTLALALVNQYTTLWDIERLASNVKNTRLQDDRTEALEDARLAKFFTNPNLGQLDPIPATVVDSHGRLILWYLPEALSSNWMASLNSSLKYLRRLLDASVPLREPNNICWQKQYYRIPEDGGDFGAGTLNLSPAWFAQGHDRVLNNLHISQDMRSPYASLFLESASSVQILCIAVTAVINPSLYNIDLQPIQAIQTSDSVIGPWSHILPWQSVWSGYAIIVNRETPSHQDIGGAPSAYGLLLSAGTHSMSYLDVPNLGASFHYTPCTIVALCGRVLRHEVKTWEGGERVCIANFMRDNVHNRLNVQRSHWSLLINYFST